MSDDHGFLDFDGAHLGRFIDAFERQHVVVVGDLMLDTFVYGEAKRISPEAPVPVLRYARELKTLGGSGNVVSNVSALGGSVASIGVIGDDAIGAEIGSLLALDRKVSHALVTIAGRPTTSKTRFLAGSQQVVRVDREEIGPIGRAEEDRIIAAVADSLRDGSVLVLADYAKGVLTDRVVAETIAAARRRGLTTVIEPKGADFARYAGATVIVANASETAAGTGMACGNDAEVEAAIRRAREIGRFDAVVCTRSEKGMAVLDPAGALHAFPARAREVFDVSGAGDTVNAVVALMLGAGASMAQAGFVANAAAGIVVGKLGTSTTSQRELREVLDADDGEHFSNKIAARDVMAGRLDLVRRVRRKVGFTNGCFDILHTGHLSLLAQARAACDFLVVGVNDDASVRRLKGEGRPVNDEESRALMLAALEMVDGVVIFSEDTPLELITALKPDVLVKGADYLREDVVGGDVVEANGGRVLLADIVPGRSTTKIIEKMGAK